MEFSHGEIITGIGVIVGAISVLWGSLWSMIKKDREASEGRHNFFKEKLENCETRHEEKDKVLLDLTKDVGELKGFKEGVEMISQRVINEVRSLVK